jgi:pimeloyl-ACP methyl ester carboxylesterase
VLRSFDQRHVDTLAEVHRHIDVPVQLVWGRHDRFFPVGWAEEMVPTFTDARLEIIDDAGLFAHEERPAQVAQALLPVISG